MKDLDRSITLYCPTCGNDQFEIIDHYDGDLKDAEGNLRIKCVDCGMIITKEELITENEYVIEANIEELKEDVIKEVERELKGVLKKWK